MIDQNTVIGNVPVDGGVNPRYPPVFGSGVFIAYRLRGVPGTITGAVNTGGGGVNTGGGGVREVSPTVTVELVATIVPLVDPVRKRAKNDSVPSVVKSLLKTTAKEPESPVIATDPPADTAFDGELKSELFIVPLAPASVQ